MMAMIAWDIDETASFAALAITPPSTVLNTPVVFVNQNASGNVTGTSWTTGNVAPLTGLVQTNYVEGSTIKFVVGSDIAGVAATLAFPDPANFVQDPLRDPGQGNFTGLPAANGGSALAVFGTAAKFTIGAQLGPFSFPSLDLNVDSALLPMSGTTFASGNTLISIPSLTYAIDAANGALNGVLGFNGGSSTFVQGATPNSGSGATVTATGATTRQLTLPFSIPVAFINNGSELINGVLNGTIVANADLAAAPPTSIVGNQIFYNQSAWDGGDAGINFVSDNLAIAPDKTAYLPGDPKAVAYNVTNYSRGINGIILDLAGTGAHGSITAADFVFKVGNNNLPSSWAAAPSPASVAVSIGAGVGGTDRVEITWASGTITNKWLEVQMLANSRTGLAAPDVFFWGNRIADSASGTLDNNNFVTNSTDAAQVFATLTPANGAAITNVRDYNRDKTVNSTDAAIVFAQLGNLNRLLVGGAGPFAPDGGGGGDAGISSALAGGSGGGASSAATPPLPVSLIEQPARDSAGTLSRGTAAVDAALSSTFDDDSDDESAVEFDELLDAIASER